METSEPLFSRKAVWFCCIFGSLHVVLTVVVSAASLGFAVTRHVTGDPPTLFANATHTISSLLLSPMIAVVTAMPDFERLLPAGLSYIVVPVNSALWAVSAWVIVWSLRRLARRRRPAPAR